MSGDVLGGQYGVFHARVARKADPLRDIQFVRRVKRGWLVAPAELVAVEGRHAEADKHTEVQILPCVKRLQGEALRACLSGGVLICAAHIFDCTCAIQKSLERRIIGIVQYVLKRVEPDLRYFLIARGGGMNHRIVPI